jgi:hypothetical protein
MKNHSMKNRSMNNHCFVHPLSASEIINTAEGEKAIMNSWALASMIWSAVLNNEPAARNIAKDLFEDNDQERKLYLSSQKGNQSSIRKAVAILAIALDERLDEAFE